MENRNEYTLLEAVEQLAGAYSDREAHQAMEDLAGALEDATAEERLEALEVLTHKIREKLLERAREATVEVPSVFLPRLPHLLALLPTIQNPQPTYMCNAPGKDRIAEITKVIHGLAECNTPPIIDAYLNTLRAILDADSGLASVGYSILRRTVEEIALTDYSNVLLMVLDKDWQGVYWMSLLSVLEDTKLPQSVLDLLYYDGGHFGLASPDSILTETNPDRLVKKLAVLRRAMPHMAPEDRERCRTQLWEEIPGKALDWITNHLRSYHLPEETRYKLNILAELTENGLEAVETDKPTADWGGVQSVLCVRRMLHKVCDHDDITYLENDWGDLQDYASECPGLGWPLTDLIRNELAASLLSDLLAALEEEGSGLPDCLELLVRLYVAEDCCRLRGGFALEADDLWEWVIDVAEPRMRDVCISETEGA